MGLNNSCLSYINQQVVIKPVYGWGWSCTNSPEIPIPADINGVPFPFSCRIKSFFYIDEELMGAVAFIEAEEHIYNGYWIIFHLRVSGIYNFTNEIAYYNVEIGYHMPDIKNGKEWPEFKHGSAYVNGYGRIGRTIQEIEKYENREKEKWEIIADTICDA
jgi:hypothetical protein